MTSQNKSSFADFLDLEDYSQYVLGSRREVHRILQKLIDNRALLSAYIMPGGQHFVTAIISLNDKEILIDVSTEEALNQKTLAASEVICVSYLDKIHIQFALNNIRQISYEDEPTFVAEIPTQLLRLQRREFYRLPTPITQSLLCTIPVPQEDSDPITILARVVDISGGGIAIIVPPGSPNLAPKMELENCRLELVDFGPVTVRLKVQNLFRFVNPNGTDILRAGCAFLDLPAGAENAIQRFIFKIERDRSARERGIV